MGIFYRLLQGLFGYKYIGYFPLIAILLIYFIPALFGVALFQDEQAWFFLAILLSTCLFYMFSYCLLSFSNGLSVLRKSKLKIVITPSFLTVIFFGCYLIFFLYVVITAPGLPVIMSFKGADGAKIVLAREQFLKAREGYESVLPYLNAFVTAVLIPYLIAVLYMTHHKLRHWVLGIFMLTLLVSLEKALIIKALLPIFVLAINQNIAIKRSHLKKILFLMVGIIVLTGFLAHAKFETTASDEQSLTQSNRYNLVGGSDTFSYLVNRAFWIPYVTAYDWLRYFDEKRDHEYLYGKTSSFVSALFGEERINVDREVFAYEWGQTETGTGSSNTAFFIEAYVNFGWLGVFIYSFIVALITKIFADTDNIPAKSVYYYYVYLLALGSLPATLLSNGLAFLILMAFLGGGVTARKTDSLKLLPQN